jgi:hypothetical protein
MDGTGRSKVPRDLDLPVPQGQDPIGSDGGIQNNIDSLWTLSLNGVKIALSLTILTGTVAIFQAVMSYWRDKVLVWWEDVKEKWTKFISNDSDRGQKGKAVTPGQNTPEMKGRVKRKPI